MGVLEWFDRRNQRRVEAMRQADGDRASVDRDVVTPDGRQLSVRLRSARDSYVGDDEGSILDWTTNAYRALSRGLRPASTRFKIGVLEVAAEPRRPASGLVAGRWARPRLLHEERDLDRPTGRRRVEQVCARLESDGLGALDRGHDS